MLQRYSRDGSPGWSLRLWLVEQVATTELIDIDTENYLLETGPPSTSPKFEEGFWQVAIRETGQTPQSTRCLSQHATANDAADVRIAVVVLGSRAQSRGK